MCPPVGLTYKLFLLIEDLVAKGKADLAIKEINKFRKKGLKVFYRVIPKKKYASKSFAKYWEQELKEVYTLRKGLYYHGSLIFATKKMKAFTYLEENTKDLNESCILRSTVGKCKDDNIYVAMVYFAKKVKVPSKKEFMHNLEH
jgi:hypothetical protein